MTAVQQRSALNLWKLFYQKAEGERFLSALAGRDRQLADLLNSAEPVPNGWGAHSAGSLLPASRNKRTLLLLQKNACGTFFPKSAPMGFKKKTLLWKSRLTHRRLPCKLPYPPIPDQ